MAEHVSTPIGDETAENGEAVAEDVLVEDVLVEDVLVEEVSIDGMCGVY